MSRVEQLEETSAKLREEIRLLRNQESACDVAQAKGMSPMAAREKTADEIIADLFKYHPPTLEAAQKYETIRDAAKHFALVIWKNCPYGSDRTAAIRKLRETVMTANAAIALDGLSL